MAKQYKIWISVEQIDEENDKYETIHEFDCGYFSDREEALEFASDLFEAVKNGEAPR